MLRAVSFSLAFLCSLTQAQGGETALDMANEGARLHSQARYAEAEVFYRRALEAWPRDEAAARGRAIVLGSLGTLLRDTGRYPEAETDLTEAEKQSEAVGGPALTDAAHLLDNLAVLHRMQGNLAKAQWCAERAAPWADDTEKSANRLVLASVYIEQRRFRAAEPLLLETVASQDARTMATGYLSMAAAALAQDQFPEGEKYSRKALEIAAQALPRNHPIVAMALNDLAQACRSQGEFTEAEKRYREALSTWEIAVGPQHPDYARGLLGLAGLYHERRRETGAESLYRRGIVVLERVYGKSSSQVLVADSELADVLRAQRRYTESDKLSRAVVAAMEAGFEPQDPRLIQAIRNRARLLSETNRTKEAAGILKRIE